MVSAHYPRVFAMPKQESSEQQLSPEAMSQDVEQRLRVLETTVQLLCYGQLHKLRRLKFDEKELAQELEELAGGILYTQQNYAPAVEPSSTIPLEEEG